MYVEQLHMSTGQKQKNKRQQGKWEKGQMEKGKGCRKS